MREKILDIAEELVQSRGLDNVTFQEIADGVGLRKPSLFHHVKNKEELVSLLIDRCSNKHGPLYDAIIAKDISAPQKLKELASLFEEGLKTGRSCLLAAISQSQQSLAEPTREQLEQTANEAVARFAAVFVQGRKEETLAFKGKPLHAAMSFLAMLQGLQSLCQIDRGQIHNDTESFKRAVKVFIDSLESSKS